MFQTKINERIRLILVIFILLFLIILVRIVYVQTIEYKKPTVIDDKSATSQETEVVDNESSTSNNSESETFDHDAEKYVSFFTFINTLSEDEIKHLIKVMKNDGIGDGYALEEVDKLWSKDI